METDIFNMHTCIWIKEPGEEASVFFSIEHHSACTHVFSRSKQKLEIFKLEILKLEMFKIRNG